MLPDQLQLLLESPQDGDVPALLYGLVRDCIQTGLAWELSSVGSLTFDDDMQAKRGATWPPGLGDVDALAETLNRPEPINGCLGIRQLGPARGLITQFFGQRLVDRHLLDTRQERHLLFLSKTTHPMSEAGQQAIASLRDEVRSTVAALAGDAIDVASHPPRAWMLAWLLDTFFLVHRALNGSDAPVEGVRKGGAATPHALRALVEGGVMTGTFAKVATEMARTADKPQSWLTIIADGLDVVLGEPAH